MLKKTFTFTDYNGNERTEDHYFHLSQAEIVRMEFSTVGGLEAMMKRIVDAQDLPALTMEFEKIIQASYGEKSPDGRMFIKEKDGRRLVDDFIQTEAYSQLFIELVTDSEAAANFVNGILPKEYSNVQSTELEVIK